MSVSHTQRGAVGLADVTFHPAFSWSRVFAMVLR